MAISDKLWNALTTVIKMNDKVVGLGEQVKGQQLKIEDLTARVIRLETALEIAIAAQGRRLIEKK
jgi:hypothetical protein